MSTFTITATELSLTQNKTRKVLSVHLFLWHPQSSKYPPLLSNALLHLLHQGFQVAYTWGITEDLKWSPFFKWWKRHSKTCTASMAWRNSLWFPASSDRSAAPHHHLVKELYCTRSQSSTESGAVCPAHGWMWASLLPWNMWECSQGKHSMGTKKAIICIKSYCITPDLCIAFTWQTSHCWTNVVPWHHVTRLSCRHSNISLKSIAPL